MIPHLTNLCHVSRIDEDYSTLAVDLIFLSGLNQELPDTLVLGFGALLFRLNSCRSTKLQIFTKLLCMLRLDVIGSLLPVFHIPATQAASKPQFKFDTEAGRLNAEFAIA